MKHQIHIGSRRSRLAQKQAHLAAQALALSRDGDMQPEFHVFQTTGDAYLAGNLSDIGTKGLFTKEIEHALLRGDIDIAVHSMKDVATIVPDGLIFPCMLPRDDVRDVLLCTHASAIEHIKQGATVGTSSLRRTVQLRYRRPDIALVGYRGNLDRRISRLESGAVDATMLAAAGLERLGITLPYATALSTDDMLPACAQGAVGLQCRSDDMRTRALLERYNHAPTMQAILAERALLRHLDGSCRTPIGGYAYINDDGDMQMEGLLANLEGTQMVRDHLSGSIEDGEAMGQALAERLRQQLRVAV